MTSAPDLAPRCMPEHGCITCGDVAVPLRVLELDDRGLALCEDDQGRRETVEVALVGAVDRGDQVLVHAGTAIAALAREPGRRESVSGSGAGGLAAL